MDAVVAGEDLAVHLKVVANPWLDHADLYGSAFSIIHVCLVHHRLRVHQDLNEFAVARSNSDWAVIRSPTVALPKFIVVAHADDLSINDGHAEPLRSFFLLRVDWCEIVCEVEFVELGISHKLCFDFFHEFICEASRECDVLIY